MISFPSVSVIPMVSASCSKNTSSPVKKEWFELATKTSFITSCSYVLTFTDLFVVCIGCDGYPVKLT